VSSFNHRVVCLALLLPLLIAPDSTPADVPPGTCRVAVLRDAGDAIKVDFVPLRPDTDEILPDDVITVILPFGTGQSGDLIQAASRANRIHARCSGGEITVSVVKPGGASHELPSVPVGDLSRYRIRVSVIGGNGFKRAFLLDSYQSAVQDSGPVIDMFQGKIPLAEGDLVVTNEISEIVDREKPAGRVRGVIADGLVFVEGANADGDTGLFVVDFGAGATVVSKGFLPRGVQVSEVYGVESSERGSRRVEGWMGGAGGEVSGFLGSAEIGDLKLGEARFERAGVMVVQEIPEIAGLHPVGILGLDLLSRAETATLAYAGRSAALELGAGVGASEGASEADDRWIPFSLVSNHMFVEGKIEGQDVSFVLDTGARGSFLAPETADRVGLELDAATGREFRGLDDRPIVAQAGSVGRLVLGGRTFRDVAFYRADLAALPGMGLTGGGGLLGNDFLERQGRLTVDFARKRMLLGE
jgi:hypothetical protein